MGCGSWSMDSFSDYSRSRGRSVDDRGVIVSRHSNQEMFKSHKLDPALDPKNVVRECCDNEEHPNTIPVILALDVTGSMGPSAVEVASKLNTIMTSLYNSIKDVEFLIMGIGDVAYDNSPCQASQFESDIRIAEQLDKLYFEFGGGGNSFESYSLAWYFGLHHTKLDCHNRGKKGIIITMGDEMLNPYIPRSGRCTSISEVLGDYPQDDIDTKELYREASEKFNIYHLNVDHRSHNDPAIKQSFTSVIGNQNYFDVTTDNISDTIIQIITDASNDQMYVGNSSSNNDEGISW